MDEVLEVIEDRDALQRDDDCVSAITFAAAAAVAAAAAAAAVVALPLAIAIDVNVEVEVAVAVALAASSANTSNIIIRVVVGESVTLRAGILHGPSTDPDPEPCKGDTVHGESLSSKQSDIIGDGFNLLLADKVITGVREAESEEEEEEVDEVDREERDDTEERQGDIGEERGA